MKLTSEELDRLADLARLRLAAEERGTYLEQLGAIIGYVESLQRLDVTGVDPTFRGTDLGQRLRADVAQECDAETRRLLVETAPERHGGYVKAQAALKRKG